MLPRQFSLAAGLVVLGATIRLLPYVLHAVGVTNVYDPTSMPWNVAPMGAICLFGGACLVDRRWAFLVPLITMVVSDLGIALLMGDWAFGFHALTPVVYGSFAVMVWAGTWLRGPLQNAQQPLRRIATIAGVGLAGEFMFFLVTNFANWALQEFMPIEMPRLYPYTPAGLVACYVAAIPFFQKSLIGLAVYGPALFGGYALLHKGVSAPQSATLAEAR